MTKKKKKEPEIKGLLDGLEKFLKTLRKIEKKGIKEKRVLGKIKKPIKGNFRCRIMVGKGLEKFKPWIRGKKKKKTKRKDPNQSINSSGLCVHETDDSILLGLDFPESIENIKIERKGKLFKIIASLPWGSLNESFSLPKGYKLAASYKAKMLHLKLIRKSMIESIIDKFRLTPRLRG